MTQRICSGLAIAGVQQSSGVGDPAHPNFRTAIYSIAGFRRMLDGKPHRNISPASERESMRGEPRLGASSSVWDAWMHAHIHCAG
jgi:hypothetical protein